MTQIAHFASKLTHYNFAQRTCSLYPRHTLPAKIVVNLNS